MGKAKKTRKFAITKKMISPKDTRIQENLQKMQQKEIAKKEKEKPRRVEKAISSLFFQYNTQLGPPYHILIDTNFINFSIRKKLDMMRSMMDCLLAKCTPCVTDWYVWWMCSLIESVSVSMFLLLDIAINQISDVIHRTLFYASVMAELEKLGGKYKIALRLAKDPRFERIPCNCTKHYADDCLVNMVTQHRCFIVATCDKELRGRIRKIPGVPCMFISGYKYTVERMPEAFGAPR
jgi:U3 small nucleolar RNA-associated protein 24